MSEITDEQWESIPKTTGYRDRFTADEWLFIREQLDALAAHPQIELKILPKTEPRYRVVPESVDARSGEECDFAVQDREGTAGLNCVAWFRDSRVDAEEYAARLNAEASR